MSASLVGSEMCIRDRASTSDLAAAMHCAKLSPNWRGASSGNLLRARLRMSYNAALAKLFAWAHPATPPQ
eukprot:3537842-Alexandrium_andersonii.AAC.1